MRGGRVRILLALATISVVGAVGISLSSNGSSAKEARPMSAAPLGPSGVSAVGATRASTKQAPAKAVSVAQGYLVPAIRSQPRVAPGKATSSRPQNELNEANPLLRVR